MNSLSEIKYFDHALNSFIVSTISERAYAWTGTRDISGFLHTNLLFGTLMFNTKGYSVPKSLENASYYAFRIMRNQYLAICRRMLGSHYNSNPNRKRQPFGFAFLDLEKATRTAGLYGTSSNPHVHFLLLTHPDCTGALNKLIMSESRTGDRYRISVRDRKIAFMDIEFFNPDKRDLPSLAAYVSKTARHPSFQNQALMYMILPEFYAGENAHLSYAALNRTKAEACLSPDASCDQSQQTQFPRELDVLLDELCR